MVADATFFLYSNEMSPEDITVIEGNSFSGLRTDTDNAYFLHLPEPLCDRYLAVACYSSQLQSTFVQLIPLENLREIPNHFRNFILIFSFLFLLVSGAFAFFTYRLVKKPVNDFMEKFRQLGDGNFGISMVPVYSYEYNELVENFNKMSYRLEHLVRENYEQTIHIQAAELKQLQAQINPHFLYNSFIFIENMISTGDYVTAEKFLYHLSKYYEYLTRSSSDTVSLKEEYSHMINYLSIQNMRFEDIFDLEIEALPEKYQTIPVPRLILQPLAENIVKHGLIPGKEEAVIRIFTTLRAQNYLCITIENTGNITAEELCHIQEILSENSQHTAGIGMNNIHTRLKLYYHDDSCGLETTASSLGGLCVTVVIRR
ncbi:MAG TPA: histidine kinase [Candidatus Eisenbergiella merdipullorum]|uniref:Histidine kinase n=1 Tax=Candidatus Eisenbergiella merdipullorum TaxID=2838553 RepID=A0A9D2I7M1_9FIRM|nr:histidine kinase [Candidatus Eisenbergiella merdipullorum]